ncbi:MAG: ABC transporter permease [Candidatus Bilamarchaeaceae archaeon]
MKENKISTLAGVYAIWWRELKVFYREKPRLVSVLVGPIIWLVIFGAGLSRSVIIEGADYQKFIFPGVLVQTFLFSSLFYGAYLVWDKKIDVLKAVLVSPLGRSSIFIGKVLGGVTISIIEALVILLFGYLIGMNYSFGVIINAISLIALSSAGLTAIGLTVGAFMESPEGFQLLSSLILFPLFFLSGALFPVTNLTGILALLTIVNPLTYTVDLMRGTVVNIWQYDTTTDLVITLVFVIVANIVGAKAFENMKS